MLENEIIESDHNLFVVDNAGPELVATNYWGTAAARAGKLLLNANAGTVRMLVPRPLENQIAEMMTGQKIWISRGPWAAMGGLDGFEILFDDHSPSPYVLHLSANSFFGLPSDGDVGRKFGFTIWIEDGNGGCRCVWRTKCRYRIVPRIPWMKP